MLKIGRANVRPNQENDRPAWRSIAQVGELSPQGFLSRFFTRAIVRLYFGERPAMPLVFRSFLLFWAVVRPMIGERPSNLVVDHPKLGNVHPKEFFLDSSPGRSFGWILTNNQRYLGFFILFGFLGGRSAHDRRTTGS